MIILMYDGYYLEIYCKDSALLQTLMQEAKKLSDTIVEGKYDDTDTRTMMYV